MKTEDQDPAIPLPFARSVAEEGKFLVGADVGCCSLLKNQDIPSGKGKALPVWPGWEALSEC